MKNKINLVSCIVLIFLSLQLMGNSLKKISDADNKIKSARVAYLASYRKKNKKKLNLQAAAYYQEHKDEIAAYRQERKDKIALVDAVRYQKNKVKITLQQAVYRQAKKEEREFLRLASSVFVGKEKIKVDDLV
ncbi:hypothetical protein KBC04_02590 [Candidatus Babeliales bacterium]|nr:hypothetical protein [Candidatus Babeliales bacterium]MBP9844060.1 hypothetical protein [Candidatus Babeliales bacterium]